MKLISTSTDLRGFDCHVHSYFSPDAKGCGAKDPRGLIADAKKAGLKGIIVTDHLDIGHWGGYIIDFDKYFKEWEQARSENPDITVYIGLEVGFEPHTVQKTYELIRDLPFEYVINSVHYWDSPQTTENSLEAYKKAIGDCWAKGKHSAFKQYLDAVLLSLDCPYEFSSVGHLGLLERYAPFDDKLLYYDEFRPLLDRIIKKCIARGAAFELNTNGNVPHADFLRAYKAAGGVRPALGSDAHDSATLGRGFVAANALLDEIWN